jgi:hypothetical protein
MILLSQRRVGSHGDGWGGGERGAAVLCFVVDLTANYQDHLLQTGISTLSTYCQYIAILGTVTVTIAIPRGRSNTYQ